MPLANTADLVAQAQANRTAVVAFNVITLEHAEGIVTGAESAQAPVILQISQNAVAYHHGDVMPLASACRAVAATARTPVALHMDHVDDLDLLHRAPAAGFSSVMFDASRLDYADNLRATREVVAWAHGHGLWVEAELGEVGGKDGVHSPTARTDPDEAAKFVEQTDVDALAVAVGSSHAMTTKAARLDLDLIRRLRDAVSIPLVLHGSSGVPEDEIRRAVSAGLTKINIGTQLNVAFTEHVRRSLADEALTDPRKYLRHARAAVGKSVAHTLSELAGDGLTVHTS